MRVPPTSGDSSARRTRRPPLRVNGVDAASDASYYARRVFVRSLFQRYVCLQTEYKFSLSLFFSVSDGELCAAISISILLLFCLTSCPFLFPHDAGRCLLHKSPASARSRSLMSVCVRREILQGSSRSIVILFCYLFSYYIYVSEAHLTPAFLFLALRLLAN